MFTIIREILKGMETIMEKPNILKKKEQANMTTI